MTPFQEILFKPESNWTPPFEYPNLTRISQIALDLETRDPNLLELGPGGIRKDGYPIGISIATEDRRWYFPFAHQEGGNLSQSVTVKYFQNLLKRTDLNVVFANALYDIEWLDFLGIQVRGPVFDVQIAAALLDEERFSYSLDNLAQDYLGLTKNEEMIDKLAKEYEAKNSKDILWRLHSKFVGPYAEDDAYLTLKLHEHLLPLLRKQRLSKTYDLECKLIPHLYAMRKKGMKFNCQKAALVSEKWEKELNDLQRRINKEAGWRVDLWSSPQLARLCLQEGVKPPKTEPSKTYPEGQYSVPNSFIESLDLPLFNAIREFREISRIKGTFVDEIQKFVVNGRIHCSFKATRDDEGGTRTGRFSANKPNLEQIPGRTEKGKEARSLFDGGIASIDFASQEPRLTVHFASLLKCKAVEKFVQGYQEDPKMDYYQFLANEVGITRTQSKTLSLAINYGMGTEKIAATLKISESEAEDLSAKFHNRAPFVKELSDHASRRASRRGYVKTLSGRRAHFDFFEPIYDKSMSWKIWKNKYPPVRGREACIKRYGKQKVRRAFVYKSMNRLIQGSAADFTKKALLDVCESTEIPVNIVHDEILFDNTDPKTIKQMAEIMESAYSLKVPMVADLSIGEHWSK